MKMCVQLVDEESVVVVILLGHSAASETESHFISLQRLEIHVEVIDNLKGVGSTAYTRMEYICSHDKGIVFLNLFPFSQDCTH